MSVETALSQWVDSIRSVFHVKDRTAQVEVKEWKARALAAEGRLEIIQERGRDFFAEYDRWRIKQHPNMDDSGTRMTRLREAIFDL